MSHRAHAGRLAGVAFGTAVVVMGAAACGSTSSPSSTVTATPKPTPTPAVALNRPATLPLAGAFTGTWNNTTYSSSGTLTATVDLTNGVFTAVTQIGGAVFGGSPPAAETFTGQLTAAGVTASGSSAIFGTYSLVATVAGDVTFTADNVPSATVATVVAHGTGSATGLTGTYQITFRNGTAPAAGTFTLTHS